MEKRDLVRRQWERQTVQPPWKPVWRCLGRLGIELPYDRGMYPQNREQGGRSLSPVSRQLHSRQESGGLIMRNRPRDYGG